MVTWIDKFMKFTDNTEPPVLFRKWTAVSVIAAALRRKCHLNWGHFNFYPNFYIVFVAPAGKARKGTALGPGYDLLQEINIRVAADSTTREALIRELKNVSDTIIHPSGKIEFHSSLTIFSKELTVFLGYNNRQLIMDLADWFDCSNRWKYQTKTQGIDEIMGVWVNLIGATTPELIQSNMHSDAVGGGLTSRIIFVYERKRAKKVSQPFLTEEEFALRKELVHDLEKISMMKGQFKMTVELMKAWDEWYTTQDEHPPFREPRLDPYLERRHIHVLKLCMIFNVARTDKMILELCDFNQALELIEQTEQKMPHTFGGYGKANHAEVLNRVMAFMAMRKTTTRTELMQQFFYDSDSNTMDNIIKVLLEIKFCKSTFNGRETTFTCIDEEQAEKLMM